jgi:Tol biopolymer transport system component
VTTRIAAVVAGAGLLFHSAPSTYYTAVQRDPGPILPGISSVSTDGAFVAFESLANLLPPDTNSSSVSDVYILDVRSRRLELASISHHGASANGSSSTPKLNHNGRYVVFESIASNLVPHKVPDCVTLFLRDRRDRTSRAIVRASADHSRILCGTRPAMSDDGRLIAFESTSVDLVDGVDANGRGADIYVADVSIGAVSRISVDNQGQQHSVGASVQAAISGDGRYVAFTSTACLDRTPPGGQPGPAGAACAPHVYVRDRVAARTQPVLGSRGRWPNGPTLGPSISADGRYVAFASTATNIIRQHVRNVSQIYLYDTENEESQLVSRTPQGRPGNGGSSMPVVAGTGRFVAFQSVASDLGCRGRCARGDRDENLVSDVFLLDRHTSRIQRLSRGPGPELWWTSSVGPALDATGRVVVFSSRHPTGPEDDRADFDLFVLRR